jgi:hypothetical protein
MYKPLEAKVIFIDQLLDEDLFDPQFLHNDKPDVRMKPKSDKLSASTPAFMPRTTAEVNDPMPDVKTSLHNLPH